MANDAMRCPKYLAWVRTLPCSLCGQEAHDAHHIKMMGVGGMGQSAPDLTVMPLCRTCHQDVHKGPANYPQAKWMIDTLKKAFYEGKIKWEM